MAGHPEESGCGTYEYVRHVAGGACTMGRASLPPPRALHLPAAELQHGHGLSDDAG